MTFVVCVLDTAIRVSVVVMSILGESFQIDSVRFLSKQALVLNQTLGREGRN